jgi:hypothetical protein
MKVRLRDNSGIRLYRFLVEESTGTGTSECILGARGSQRSV